MFFICCMFPLFSGMFSSTQQKQLKMELEEALFITICITQILQVSLTSLFRRMSGLNKGWITSMLRIQKHGNKDIFLGGLQKKIISLQKYFESNEQRERGIKCIIHKYISALTFTKKVDQFSFKLEEKELLLLGFCTMVHGLNGQSSTMQHYLSQNIAIMVSVVQPQIYLPKTCNGFLQGSFLPNDV